MLWGIGIVFLLVNGEMWDVAMDFPETKAAGVAHGGRTGDSPVPVGDSPTGTEMSIAAFKP
jgi:hypothetical protein